MHPSQRTRLPAFLTCRRHRPGMFASDVAPWKGRVSLRNRRLSPLAAGIALTFILALLAPAAVASSNAGPSPPAILSSQGGSAPAPTVLPSGFRDSIVLSGLTEPTAVRFSPDGRVFVAEKSGIVKVFDNLTDTSPTVFVDLRTNVHNFWDRGLLGLALAPNFPVTPWVYVLYTYDAAIGGTAPRWAARGRRRPRRAAPPGARTCRPPPTRRRWTARSCGSPRRPELPPRGTRGPGTRTPSGSSRRACGTRSGSPSGRAPASCGSATSVRTTGRRSTSSRAPPRRPSRTSGGPATKGSAATRASTARA